jgi:WD40 repeat protein
MNDNPYVGPRSIGGVDHQGEQIYGRTRETSQLVDLLIADRVMLVYSPSGAGKSSLLQAGLAPAMMKQRFQVRPIVRVNLEPPTEANFDREHGNRYTLSALLSLEEGLPKDTKKTPVTELARMTLLEYLGEEANGELLIFDQFEEVLTVDPLDVEKKTEFFTQVGSALRDRGRWAVFAMREDYLAGLDPYLNRVPTRFSNTFRLGLLEKEEALEAVYMPAEAAGVEFTRDAASLLVENLSSIRVQYDGGRKEESAPGLYVEPVQLQVVCRRIWGKLPAGTKTIGIDDIGGVSTVDDALSAYYEDTVRDVSRKCGVSERAIRDWFGRALITRQKTRSQVSQSDDRSVAVHSALKPLVDSYLIRSDRRLGSYVYELAHDRLIGPVLENNAQNISDLQKAAELWERQGRPDGLLLNRKQRLRLDRGNSSGLEAEFLDKSRRHQNAQWIVRGLGGLVAMVMVAAIWLLLLNYQSQAKLDERDAEIQSKDRKITEDRDKLDAEIRAHDEADKAAETSRQNEATALGKLQEQTRFATSNNLSNIAEARRGGRLDLAALLAIEAWHHLPSNDSRFTLFDMVRSNPRAMVMLHHENQVHVVAFGPPGMLATGCSDGTIWIWNVQRRISQIIDTKGGAVYALSFNRDGLLASGAADGWVRLWDPKTRQSLPGSVQAHRGRVNTVAFDPGGRILISGGQDGLIRFWAVQDRQLAPATGQDGVPASLRPGGEVKSAGIFLANREVVAARSGGAAMVWNLDAPDRPGYLVSPSDNNGNGEFAGISETGRKFAVKGNENVRVWAPGRGGPLSARYGKFEEGWMWTAAIAPVQNLIAIGGNGRKVQVYDLASSAKPRIELQGPENVIKQVTFSRDATQLASLSENDRSVWIWDMRPTVQSAASKPVGDPAAMRGDPLQNVAMDPNGRWFVTTFSSRGSQLASFSQTSPGQWQLTKKVTLSGYFSDTWRQDWRPRLAASPKSSARQFLAVGEASGRISLRDPLSLTEIGSIASVRGQIANVVLNFDGTLLAVTGWRGNPTLRIYSLADLAHPELLVTMQGPVSPLEAAAFSPTRNLLALGGNTMMGEKVDPQNSEIRLWDLQDPRKPKLAATLPLAEAHSTLFSPDGKTLVTAGEVLSLWDVPEGPAPEKPKQLVPRAILGATIGWPRRMQFSPKGDVLATAESDEPSSTAGMRIHLWDTERGVRFGDPLEFPWPVDVAAFEPDDKGLLLWTALGIQRVPLDEKAWIPDLCARANRNLSRREWDVYVGTGDYHETCSLPRK